jgi:hypothetical protein
MDSARLGLESQLIRDELKSLRQSINELSLDIAMSQRTSSLLAGRDASSQPERANVHITNSGGKKAEDSKELSPLQRNPWAARLDLSPIENSQTSTSIFKYQDDDLIHAVTVNPNRYSPLLQFSSSASRLKGLVDENSELLTEKERELTNDVATLK